MNSKNLFMINEHEKVFIRIFAKRSYKKIRTLESKLEMLKNKIKKNEYQTHGKKIEFERNKNEKFELKILEGKRKLAILEDLKNKT